MSDNELKKQVRYKVMECLTLADEHFDFDEFSENVVNVEVLFNLRGDTVGVFQFGKRKRYGKVIEIFNYKLRFNLAYMRLDINEYLKNTVPHEVAHLVALHIDMNSKPHGELWKEICITLGGNGKRLNNYFSVDTIYKDKVKCTGCGLVLPVSKRMYNSIASGRSIYRDKKCKSILIAI